MFVFRLIRIIRWLLLVESHHNHPRLAHIRTTERKSKKCLSVARVVHIRLFCCCCSFSRSPYFLMVLNLYLKYIFISNILSHRLPYICNHRMVGKKCRIYYGETSNDNDEKSSNTKIYKRKH